MPMACISIDKENKLPWAALLVLIGISSPVSSPRVCILPGSNPLHSRWGWDEPACHPCTQQSTNSCLLNRSRWTDSGGNGLALQSGRVCYEGETLPTTISQGLPYTLQLMRFARSFSMGHPCCQQRTCCMLLTKVSCCRKHLSICNV